ncbi:MAG: M48 family metalloprotease [Sedimenticola sp.]|nr:M48 family metalloprotease [Sedimenticola sp.]
MSKYSCWRRILGSFIGITLVVSVTGCATNPVTGENELALVSEESELAIGKAQYQPSRQMQGGDYQLDPGLIRYVQSVGQRLVAVSDRKLPYEFVVLNDSTPNAWALPGGKIAVNRGLLMELDNEAELAAVLGHEIVHAAARHGAQGIERGIVLKGVLIAAGVAARDSDYSQLAVGAAALGANLLNQGYSRDAELEADLYGMTYMVRAGYDPMAAVGLQETFVRLSKDRKQNWLSGLFASHPPSNERVEKNRETARRLATGGELGRERYQQQIAPLRQAAAGYEAHAKGVEAMSKKAPGQALAFAQKAIKVEPKEAIFHGLKGDALVLQGKTSDALAAYNEAVQLDSNFFRHFLKRGALKAELGDRQGAKQDLDKSLELLPTADAHYLLGELALREGDRRRALTHYQTASSSSSGSGRAAATALVRLDLQDHPQKYLATALAVDPAGRLLVQLENSTSVSIRNIQIQLGERSSNGRVVVRAEYQVPGKLKSAQRTVLKSDIRLPDARALSRWAVRVTRAVVDE